MNAQQLCEQENAAILAAAGLPPDAIKWQDGSPIYALNVHHDIPLETLIEPFMNRTRFIAAVKSTCEHKARFNSFRIIGRPLTAKEQAASAKAYAASVAYAVSVAYAASVASAPSVAYAKAYAKAYAAYAKAYAASVAYKKAIESWVAPLRKQYAPLSTWNGRTVC